MKWAHNEPMLIDIRRASPKDIDWLMDRLKKLSDFAGSKHVLFESSDYARNGMLHLIEKHVVLIAERRDFSRGVIDNSDLIGFIGGYLIQHPFNPKLLMLSELFWWVDEDARGSSAGGRLLHSFIEIGKRVTDWIILGLNVRTPIKAETILRLGFKLHESCYLLETEK